jgi:hypothetical protein
LVHWAYPHHHRGEVLMPSRRMILNTRGAAWPGVVALIAVIALWVFVWLAVYPGAKLGKQVHKFMGSNRDPNPINWTGLSGNLSQHAIEVRKALNDLDCRVWMLEHNVTTRPPQCPPGPPAQVPKDPPGYPP